MKLTVPYLRDTNIDNVHLTATAYQSIHGLFQKWKVREAKQSHIRTFSTENWKVSSSSISNKQMTLLNIKL